MTRLYVVPLELAEANRVVEILHRHHDRLPVHRFSIGAIDGGGHLHGVAICSRPASRELSSRDVLEVSRLCTDGTPNACSILYGAAARIGKAMGYRRVQTYILDSEAGTSLTASGWHLDGYTSVGHTWSNRPGRTHPEHLQGSKGRWIKDLDKRPDLASFPDAVEATFAPTLDFGASA